MTWSESALGCLCSGSGRQSDTSLLQGNVTGGGGTGGGGGSGGGGGGGGGGRSGRGVGCNGGVR
eukprot:SAG22_NODE_18905_length_280_cov_0.817680_1_plen_63_part_01